MSFEGIWDPFWNGDFENLKNALCKEVVYPKLGKYISNLEKTPGIFIFKKGDKLFEYDGGEIYDILGRATIQEINMEKKDNPDKIISVKEIVLKKDKNIEFYLREDDLIKLFSLNSLNKPNEIEDILCKRESKYDKEKLYSLMNKNYKPLIKNELSKLGKLSEKENLIIKYIFSDKNNYVFLSLP
jgi:hypothetical protein